MWKYIINRISCTLTLFHKDYVKSTHACILVLNYTVIWFHEIFSNKWISRFFHANIMHYNVWTCFHETFQARIGTARLEKWKIYFHWKKFRQINYFVISLVNRYFHEIFAKKVWKHSASALLWKNKNLQSVKKNSSNQLFSKYFL